MQADRNCIHHLAKAFVAICLLLFTACGQVMIESASIAADRVTLLKNIDAAQAQDAAAQYAIGDALCCSGNLADGSFYSTEDSLRWLCAAARQGNTKAMLKLGKIFEGDQVEGPRLIRRVTVAAADTPQNRAAAYYWYATASNAGLENAAEAANALNYELTVADREMAARYFSGTEAPCRWADLQSRPVQ